MVATTPATGSWIYRDMKNILWYIKVIVRQRRCVRCGKLLFGEAEGVNVYDRVVGRRLGVRCLKGCALKVGSPEWVKKYWLAHALDVLHRPDYFSKYAYESAVNDYADLVIDKEVSKRIVATVKYLNRKYPNKYDK